MAPFVLRRPETVLRGHPYRQDVLIALVTLGLGLLPNSAKHLNVTNMPVLQLITVAVESLPLIWRRRAPLPVFWVVLAASLVQWAAAEDSASGLSLLICIYTLSRYASPRALQVAVGASVAGLLVNVFRVAVPQRLVIQTVLFYGAAIAASVAIGRVAEERKAQLTRLAERAAHAEFEREQRARMAVLAERARFSREMHDIVGHTLAVITGLADGGVRQVEADPQRGRQVLELIGDTSRGALSDLRRTLGALRERPLDEGVEGLEADALAPQAGVADIGQLLERTRAAGPRVSYTVSGELADLPRSLQLAIYRIVQESLTNSLKHAGPDTSVQVAIEAEDGLLRLSVSDTGPDAPAPFHGAAAPAEPGPEGQGLTGVRERAALAGGRAEAGRNRAGGWTVTARFPLNPAEEQ